MHEPTNDNAWCGSVKSPGQQGSPRKLGSIELKNTKKKCPTDNRIFPLTLTLTLTCHQYPWAKNSVISTPGPGTLSLVPLGQELCHQYPWAKNSVIGTPGPRTLSSVPLGQELCHQYPWVKNSLISNPGPRTLSSVPLGQELCH